MTGDLFSRHKVELQQWCAAIKDLRNNPLAQYLQLMRKRRLARLPWYRRNAIVLLGLVLGFGSTLSGYLLLGSTWSSNTIEPSQYTSWLVCSIGVEVAGVAVAVAFFWFCQTLLAALYSAFAFLSLPGRRNSAERIDDGLGLSELTNYEIGAAVIQLTFSPVVLPLALFHLLNIIQSLLWSSLYEFTMGSRFTSDYAAHMFWCNLDTTNRLDEFALILLSLPQWKWLLVSTPFEIVFAIIGGWLGCLLLICVLIVFGRSQRPTVTVPLVVFSMIWIFLVLDISFGAYHPTISAGAANGILLMVILMLAGGLAIPVFGVLAVRQSLIRRISVGPTSAFLVNLYLPVVISTLVFAYGLFPADGVVPALTSGVTTKNIPLLTLDYLASGALIFSPFGPVSSFDVFGWTRDSTTLADFPWPELFRGPVHLIIQLGMLTALAPLVTRAINLRRRNAE